MKKKKLFLILEQLNCKTNFVHGFFFYNHKLYSYGVSKFTQNKKASAKYRDLFQSRKNILEKKKNYYKHSWGANFSTQVISITHRVTISKVCKSSIFFCKMCKECDIRNLQVTRKVFCPYHKILQQKFYFNFRIYYSSIFRLSAADFLCFQI